MHFLGGKRGKHATMGKRACVCVRVKWSGEIKCKHTKGVGASALQRPGGSRNVASESAAGVTHFPSPEMISREAMPFLGPVVWAVARILILQAQITSGSGGDSIVERSVSTHPTGSGGYLPGGRLSPTARRPESNRTLECYETQRVQWPSASEN